MDEIGKGIPERTTQGHEDRTEPTISDSILSHGDPKSNGNGHLADGDFYDNIPDELKPLPQWVSWRFGKPKPNGKRPKYPKNPRTGDSAAVDDPETWGTFAEAVDAVTRFRLDGVGYVFTEDDGFVGVDLDGCRDPVTGELQPWALDIMRRLDSYTEASVSGTGIHLLVKGKLLAGGGKSGDIEVYEKGRFFTMSGEHIGGMPTTIEARQEQLDAFYREHFAHKLPKEGKQAKTKRVSAKQTATLREIASALQVIPSDEHDVWLHVGMAVHSVNSDEAGFILWTEWSKSCPSKFDLSDCEKRWKSFSPGGGITPRTIFGLAIDRGWRSPSTLKVIERVHLAIQHRHQQRQTQAHAVFQRCQQQWHQRRAQERR